MSKIPYKNRKGKSNASLSNPKKPIKLKAGVWECPDIKGGVYLIFSGNIISPKLMEWAERVNIEAENKVKIIGEITNKEGYKSIAFSGNLFTDNETPKKGSGL